MIDYTQLIVLLFVALIIMIIIKEYFEQYIFIQIAFVGIMLSAIFYLIKFLFDNWLSLLFHYLSYIIIISIPLIAILYYIPFSKFEKKE